jgi:hypothetical protein
VAKKATKGKRGIRYTKEKKAEILAAAKKDKLTGEQVSKVRYLDADLLPLAWPSQGSQEARAPSWQREHWREGEDKRCRRPSRGPGPNPEDSAAGYPRRGLACSRDEVGIVFSVAGTWRLRI